MSKFFRIGDFPNSEFPYPQAPPYGYGKHLAMHSCQQPSRLFRGYCHEACAIGMHLHKLLMEDATTQGILGIACLFKWHLSSKCKSNYDPRLGRGSGSTEMKGERQRMTVDV